MAAINRKELAGIATKMLRTRGLTWSGRPQQEVRPEQCSFERRIIRIPANGKPKPSNPRPTRSLQSPPRSAPSGA